MTTIVTRAGKGSSLTWTEMDANLTNLNNNKLESGGALGTPVSGTLTNCTGLPAAGVTGTALVSAAIGTTVQAYDADIPTVSASQAEMEAGTEANLRSMSPLRVAQAISALAIGIPQNSQNAGYTLVLTDNGKHINMATAGAFTIPANSSVAFPIGAAITFYNPSAACTIAITTDTLRFSGAGTTGTRTIAQYGLATILKVASTTWVISGTGIS